MKKEFPLKIKNYNTKDFSFVVILMFCLCFLAFTETGQNIWITFIQVIATLSIFLTLYVATCWYFETNSEGDVLVDSEKEKKEKKNPVVDFFFEEVDEDECDEEDIIVDDDEDEDTFVEDDDLYDESEVAKKSSDNYQNLGQPQLITGKTLKAHLNSQKVNKEKKEVESNSQAVIEEKTEIQPNSQDVNEEKAETQVNSQDVNEEKAKIQPDSQDVNEEKAKIQPDSQDVNEEKTETQVNSQDVLKTQSGIQHVIASEVSEESAKEQLNIYEAAKEKGKDALFFGIDSIRELLRFFATESSVLDFENAQIKVAGKYFSLNSALGPVLNALNEQRCYTSFKVIKAVRNFSWKSGEFWNSQKVEKFLKKFFQVIPSNKRELREALKNYIPGIDDDYEKILQSEGVYQEFILCINTFKRKTGLEMHLVTNNIRLKELALKNEIEVLSVLLGEVQVKGRLNLEEVEDSDRIFLFDRDVLEHLAQYFEEQGFKYGILTTESTIARMSLKEAALVMAMKARACYVSNSVVNSFMEARNSCADNSNSTAHKADNAAVRVLKKSEFVLPEKYCFLVNRFNMIKAEDVIKQNPSIPESTEPTLLEYALYLKKKYRKKVSILSTKPEFAGISEPDINVICL